MPALLKISLASLAILLLGLALGAAATNAQQQGGQMVVDCEGNTRAVDRDCQYGSGQQFTVAIHVTQAPSGGYTALQTKLRWNQGVLTYHAASQANNEVVWPPCNIQARADNSTAGGTDAGPSVLFACIPFTAIENQGAIAPTSFTGPVLLFRFTCSGNGTSTLTLVPRVGDPQLGSQLLDKIGNAIDPTLQSASVECGGAQQQRPPPQFGTRQAGAMTPVSPDATIAPPRSGNDPDGNNNGQNGTGTPETPGLTPTEGTAIATNPTFEATGTVTSGTGSTGDDGGGSFPIWAWIVIGVAVVGGVGGAGYAGWRRYQAGQTGGPGDHGSSGPADTNT
ncbi:MAG: hypothetical protein WBD55_05935 [Dehalococcoidia bacterium]